MNETLLAEEKARAGIQKAEVNIGAAQTRLKEAQKELEYDSGWTPVTALSLGFGILVFGLLVIGFMSRLIAKPADVNAIIRAFALILIIVASVFLIVTGYSQDQIAPVMGLLGTIAGYLLGTHEKDKAAKDQNPAQG